VHEGMARLVRLLPLPASEMSAFENPRSADWSAVDVVQRQHGSPSSSPLDWPSPSVSAWQSALVQVKEAARNALVNLSPLAWPVDSPRASPLGTRAMYSRRAEAGVAASARRSSAEAGAGLACVIVRTLPDSVCTFADEPPSSGAASGRKNVFY